MYNGFAMVKGHLLILPFLSLCFVSIIAFSGEANPYAIATGAETLGYYSQLFPLLREAGVSFVRIFPEWANIQPKENQWDFSLADDLVKCAKENDLQILGIFLYLAPWVSAKPPSTRAFPIKDIRYWRDYVREVVKRYSQDIKYWEVYNEFAAFSENGTHKDYAELVINSYDVVKEIDPQCKVGLNWNEFDLSSLEKVIKLGAGGHFDFVCVHPYAILDRVMLGREEAILTMMENFKKMLRKTGQREDIPLWVTEIGIPATDDPASEKRQAEALIKAYVLCLLQGIERIFWFEGRGPTYGPGGSFGILKEDWSKRASYYALQTLIKLLGPNPKYLGWFPLSDYSHSYVFRGEKGVVMVSWASKDERIRLPKTVKVIDYMGQSVSFGNGNTLSLSSTPVFLLHLPTNWIIQAINNKNKPFPWLKDYRKATEVRWSLGKDGKDIEKGLYRIPWQRGKNVIKDNDTYALRTDRNNKDFYIEFDVADSFASVGDNELEITVVARRLDEYQPEGTGCNIIYESTEGYKTINDWWSIPPGTGWYEHTFHIKDANFANCWGWNFSISVVASPGDICVKEVIVRKQKTNQ
ncbi:endo-1,4-beta-xylanase [bacterium]|nr:endo-1,4-beta-xylanase [bacterium]